MRNTGAMRARRAPRAVAQGALHGGWLRRGERVGVGKDLGWRTGANGARTRDVGGVDDGAGGSRGAGRLSCQSFSSADRKLGSNVKNVGNGLVLGV